MSENIFYVYEHWRPDTGVCFYVGKGKKQRAWMMRTRNRHHRSIQSKLLSLGLTVDVRIVIADLTEETAFAVERDRIALHGRDMLVNWTDGGDGVANPTAEARAKIAAALIGNQHSRGVKRTTEQRAAISARMKGNKRGNLAARNKSPEHRVKVKAAMEGRKGRKQTVETRAKISAYQKTKIVSLETRRRMSVAIKASWPLRRKAVF